jgi:predicted metal-binding protein
MLLFVEKRQGNTRVAVPEANKDGTDETREGPIVYVCVTCRLAGDPDEGPRAGRMLADATTEAARGTGVSVRHVECLANCSRSLSAAMRKKNSWTYVFGELNAPDDAAALVEGAKLLATAEDGILPWRGRPQALKGGLIARVPPLVLGPFPEDFE